MSFKSLLSGESLSYKFAKPPPCRGYQDVINLVPAFRDVQSVVNILKYSLAGIKVRAPQVFPSAKVSNSQEEPFHSLSPSWRQKPTNSPYL